MTPCNINVVQHTHPPEVDKANRCHFAISSATKLLNTSNSSLPPHILAFFCGIARCFRRFIWDLSHKMRSGSGLIVSFFISRSQKAYTTLRQLLTHTHQRLGVFYPWRLLGAQVGLLDPSAIIFLLSTLLFSLHYGIWYGVGSMERLVGTVIRARPMGSLAGSRLGDCFFLKSRSDGNDERALAVHEGAY